MLKRLLISAMLSGAVLPIFAKRYIDTLPAESRIVEGYSNQDSVTQRLAELPLVSAEGIWQLTSDGGVVAIERDKNALHGDGDRVMALRMVVISSPNRAVRPGTVLGHLAPTADAEIYEAKIYTSMAEGGKLRNAKTFRLKAERDALQFHRERKGLTVRWTRILPFMFSRMFDYEPDDHNDTDGLVRLKEQLPRYF